MKIENWKLKTENLQTLITFNKLSAKEKWEYVIKDNSFNVKKWEWVFFTWPSWSWKNKILNVITWELNPCKWTVEAFWNTLDFSDSENLQKYKQNLWVVLNNLKLIPYKTIYENIEFVLLLEENNPEKINNILKRINIDKKSWSFPEELSAWDRQKACLARALVLNPKILILDEITSHLDEASKRSIFSLLKELKKEGGLTVIWTSSIADLTRWLADRIYKMEGGCLV